MNKVQIQLKYLALDHFEKPSFMVLCIDITYLYQYGDDDDLSKYLAEHPYS